jgi:hypothetical protein
MKKEMTLKEKDLVFLRPEFICFSNCAQIANLTLPISQTDPSESQRSQFFAILFSKKLN